MLARAGDRTVVNDGPIQVPDQDQLNADCIEVFLRTMLKPVNDNYQDYDKENLVSLENFSFDGFKRLYMQDLYRSLLSTDVLYNQLKVKTVDNKIPLDQGGTVTIPSNMVEVFANDGSASLISDGIRQKINGVLGSSLGPVELKNTWFHSTMEFADSTSTRHRGLYDTEELATANVYYKEGEQPGGLFVLGMIEKVFDEEEKWLKEDVRAEHGVLTFQTLARRLVELFARLSNLRLSFLFYTDIMRNYKHAEVVAALDIFYNMMSRISEAGRLHVDNPFSPGNMSPYGDAKLFFAKLAGENKHIADFTRPVLFVNNLVCEMMSLVMMRWPEKYTDGTITVNYEGYKEELCKCVNHKFPWFARTNTNKLNDPTTKCTKGDFKQAFTGIHLKLLPNPNPNGGDWTEPQITEMLGKGLDALADAFDECFQDSEVLKILDTTGSTPVANNLPNMLSRASGATEDSQGSTSFGNAGELQYALMIERIIEKVYRALKVRASSYFISDVPKLNVDIGLRFLTDTAIKEINDIKGEKAYSKVCDYVDRVATDENVSNFTKYILTNVVTTKENGVTRINPSFDFYLKKWSLCPFRDQFDDGVNEAAQHSTSESEVGNDTYTVEYSAVANSCPFAEKIESDPPVEGSEKPLSCKLRDFFTSADWPHQGWPMTEEEFAELKANLKSIPPVCPCIPLAKILAEKAGAIPPDDPTIQSSLRYLHSLFKEVDPIKWTEEEQNALGYAESDDIYKNKPQQGLVDYAHTEHSNVNLVHLDQLIRLCKDLYKFNMRLMLNEPYLKTKVEKCGTHYYGNERYGSFEPVTCYRFSNFHAQNKECTKCWTDDKPQAMLKYFARTISSDQYVTAVNRDLSGETEKENGIWERILTLDNERTIPGTENIRESQMTHTYFTDAEITSGLVTTQAQNISRKSNVTYNFYQIHLMDELSGKLTDNKYKSLVTMEVYVKRFRPIFLPNADEIFSSDDRGEAPNTTLEPTGWSVIPHKYTADAHFSKDIIIVPMNTTASNPPRGKWFHELDNLFAPVNKKGDAYIAGYAKYTLSNYPDTSGATDLDKYVTVSFDPASPNTKEYEDFAKYHYRDWLYPATMIVEKPQNTYTTYSANVQAEHQAVSRLPDWTNYNYSSKNPIMAGASSEEELVIKRGTDRDHDFRISQSNREYFDIHECIDSNVHQDTALTANWLYITTPPPKSGIEISQCMNPLPWLWWHSARDGHSHGAGLWCQGLGHPGQGYENGFCSRDMRWHAVNEILAEVPVKLKIAGSDDANTNAPVTSFAKGFYDPDCCGTNKTWELHGSNRYGYKNGHADWDGGAYDRYYLTYEKSRSGIYNIVTENPPPPGSGEGQAPFNYTKYNQTIWQTLANKPMTWSLWNVIRHSLWYTYYVCDLDFNPNDEDRPDCQDRHALGLHLSADELEYKTLQGIRAMYDEWYKRFTYNGQYTSQCISTLHDGWGVAWPYKTEDTDPADYWQAQRLLKGGQMWRNGAWSDTADRVTTWGTYDDGKGQKGHRTHVEWTNLVAEVVILYNEVSHTHDSCLTVYTGAHPLEYKDGNPSWSSGANSNNPMRGAGSNMWPNHGWGSEYFNRYQKMTDRSWADQEKEEDDNRISNMNNNPAGAPFAGWQPCSGTQNIDTRYLTDPEHYNGPFRYALPGVDMCRNFMAFIYRGWNSSVPNQAIINSDFTDQDAKRPLYMTHGNMPSQWALSKMIHTVNVDGNIIDRVDSSASGYEYDRKQYVLRDIYPPSEENDTEFCDSNFLQRLMLPIYPNWESLHDSTGKPLHPDAVTDEQYKKVIFCVAPMSYWDAEHAFGHQCAERMMGFVINQFLMGEEAEKLTSNFDTEFFSGLADPVTAITADPGLAYNSRGGRQYHLGMDPTGMSAANYRGGTSPYHFPNM